MTTYKQLLKVSQIFSDYHEISEGYWILYQFKLVENQWREFGHQTVFI